MTETRGEQGGNGASSLIFSPRKTASIRGPVTTRDHWGRRTWRVQGLSFGGSQGQAGLSKRNSFLLGNSVRLLD